MKNSGRIISLPAVFVLCLAAGMAYAEKNFAVVMSTLVHQGYEKGGQLFAGETITIRKTRSFAFRLDEDKEYAFAVFGSDYFKVSLESGGKTFTKETSGWFNYDGVAVFYHGCSRSASYNLVIENCGGGSTGFTTWLFRKK